MIGSKQNTQSHEELLQIAINLDSEFQLISKPEVNNSIQSLLNATNEIDESFGDSWIGYHSNVYYKNFNPIPAGARFSSEWGLQDTYAPGTRGDWVEYTPEEVEKEIFKRADNSDLTILKKVASEAKKIFEDNASEVLSILSTEISLNKDDYLIAIKSNIEKLEFIGSDEILKRWNPDKNTITRDAVAAGQGIKAPAHKRIQAQLVEVNNAIAAISELSKFAKKAGSHLARKIQKTKILKITGNHVFIGHGNSLIWKDLKDFVKEELNLPYDEFNRVSAAGITNVARLSEMLDNATIAFIVLTGEDDQINGNRHARMNVIHEVGLFQGRLGFSKTIILLEDGCEEFSNIEGLGQIRFPKGDIGASFEKIRRVLKRENLIN